MPFASNVSGVDERNPACVLAGHGSCGGKISGEHYISHAVLRRLTLGKSITISGTAWTAAGPKTVGLATLTAKIVCQRHNSELSNLDSIGGRWLASIQEAQLDLASKSARCRTHTFDGLRLERWFLKIAFMLWHSGNFASSGIALPGAPPTAWGDLLVGTAPFPPAWGLYIHTGGAPFVAVDRQFSAMPITGGDGSGIKAVHFEIAKVPFHLLLGKPDHLADWGTRRPQQVDLGNDAACHRLRLIWPEGAAGEAVTVRRVAGPPS